MNQSVVISDTSVKTTVNGTEQVFDLRTVISIDFIKETSRTWHVRLVNVEVTLNGEHKGYGYRHSLKKPVIFNKKNPMATSWLIDGDKYSFLNKMKQDAFVDAYRQYLKTLKNLKGRVLFFDRSRGEGMVKVDSLGTTFSLYACNLKGKKTWYAETACVYLERDQEIVIDHLGEVEHGLTAVVNEGVKFDAEKWASLDQDRLAFKCDEEGNAINGLFSAK